MEVRLSFTIADHGRDPANGERFMDAFMEVFPDGGPSVIQNTADGTLTVTFALDADDAKAAVKRGITVFVEGARATKLPATEVLDIEASVVRAEEAEEAPDREPVPA